METIAFGLRALPLVALPVFGALDGHGPYSRRTLTAAAFVVLVLVGVEITLGVQYAQGGVIFRFLLVPAYGLGVLVAGLPLYVLGYEWDAVAGSEPAVLPSVASND